MNWLVTGHLRTTSCARDQVRRNGRGFRRRQCRGPGPRCCKASLVRDIQRGGQPGRQQCSKQAAQALVQAPHKAGVAASGHADVRVAPFAAREHDRAKPGLVGSLAVGAGPQLQVAAVVQQQRELPVAEYAACVLVLCLRMCCVSTSLVHGSLRRAFLPFALCHALWAGQSAPH